MVNSDDVRRLSCSSISSRRTSICSSRISEIPVENIVQQSKVATLQWQLKEVNILLFLLVLTLIEIHGMYVQEFVKAGLFTNWLTQGPWFIIFVLGDAGISKHLDKIFNQFWLDNPKVFVFF